MENDDLIIWFKRWRRPLRQWLSHRSSIPAVDLDDMAQEVFMRVLRYSDDEVVKNPQGYLFRIAANVANEWAERSRNRQPHDDSWLDELIEPGEGQPETQFEKESFERSLQRMIDGLPNRMGIILIEHIWEGKPYKQIAEELGVTYRIVLRDLTHAYATMRAQLGEEYREMVRTRRLDKEQLRWLKTKSRIGKGTEPALPVGVDCKKP